MDNKKVFFAFAISLILILSVSSVYAFGLGDFFKNLFSGGKITGNVVADSSKIINIDFGTSSTSKSGFAVVGNVGDFWNSFAAVHTGPGSYQVNNLKFANSQSSSVSMAALEFYSSWGISYGGVNDPMFDNYIYSYQPPSKASKLVFANVPSGTYDFYVYGHEGDYGDQYELISGGTSYGVKSTEYSHDVYTSSNWVEGLHYVVFENVVVASTKNVTLIVGNLASKKSYSGAIINGLQIVPAGTDRVNQTSNPVNGVCGYGIGVCTKGTVSNYYENDTGYYWTCLGQNGGVNDSCNYPKSGSPNTNVTLSVNFTIGNGTGYVWTQDPGNYLVCESSLNQSVICQTLSYVSNTTVNLTIYPYTGSILFRYYGCDSLVQSDSYGNPYICSVYMSSNKKVGFQFAMDTSYYCSDSDGGFNIYTSGYTSGFNVTSYIYNDTCYQPNYLVEHTCGGDNLPSNVDVGNWVMCLNGCSNGACIQNETSQNGTCYDNDGGINYLLNGSTWGTMANGSSVILNDYCNLGPNGIYEGYCNSNNEPVWYANISACPNGCMAGACIQNQTPLPTCLDFGYNTQDGEIIACDGNSTQQYDLSVCRNMTYSCTDYDDGENYFFKSYVSGGVSSRTGPSCNGDSGRAGGGKGALSDTCLDSNIIREAVCTVDERSNYTDYSCSSGCANGACINDTRSCDYGCFLNSKCVPVGYRKAPQYCDVDGIMKDQREKVGEEYAVCDNNYECESNVCSAGKCVEVNELLEEVSGFRAFVIKSLCRLGTLVGDDYEQCIADNLGGGNQELTNMTVTNLAVVNVGDGINITWIDNEYNSKYILKIRNLTSVIDLRPIGPLGSSDVDGHYITNLNHKIIWWSGDVYDKYYSLARGYSFYNSTSGRHEIVLLGSFSDEAYS